jgi:hypothetical protein
MYTKTSQQLAAIDSVIAVKGSFTFHPWRDEEPSITLEMMYANKANQTTFGLCPARSSVLSPKTLEAFRAFLEAAEEDFGRRVLDNEISPPFGPRVSVVAESEDTLRGLGEG